MDLTREQALARTAAARAARTAAKHKRWAAELAAAGWSVAAPGEVSEQTITALKNLQWMVDHREGRLSADAETVLDTNGGFVVECLIHPGLTPVT